VKPGFIDFLENARSRKSQKFRNQLYIFLICLIVSVFIWILVRLSKEYFYSVDYRLTYKNVPGGYRLFSVSDSILTFNLKAQGYEFFSERLFRTEDQHFEVNLANVKIKPAGIRYKGYLLTGTLGFEIISQTRYKNRFLEVSPDTLFFTFEHSRK
jgi:hypothetical protein